MPVTSAGQHRAVAPPDERADELTPALLTFGHGTTPAADLTGLLGRSGVGLVVDVRRHPGSRRNPEVAGGPFADRLDEAGIGYRWDPRLGGRRRVPAGQDPAVDAWWRVEAFRAYAAHMRTDEFRSALAELVASTRSHDRRTAIMCSETVWWRCHRRLISDAATLLHDVPVLHLGHDGRLTPHPVADGAAVVDGDLRYDAPAAQEPAHPPRHP